MAVTSEIPVLIVGAGPTGLTAALELSRLGVPVRIVDRAPHPSPTSRALAVQARTLELLRVRGVGDEMLSAGHRASAAALHAGGRELASIELFRMSSDFNFILMLAQSETERLLTEQLARQGVKVDRGVEVTAVNSGSDGEPVRVTLEGAHGAGETLSANYVIAADGPHSTLRKALAMDFPGRTLPHNYVLADLHIDGDVVADQVSIFLAAGGFVALFPMGAHRFRLMATDPHGLVAADSDPSVEHLQTLYDRVVHVPARLHDLNWSSRFRINSRHVRALRSGRVYFGGDSAHVHSPAGGQGMNLGIQDMINLSWKLAMVHEGRAKPELLDTYSERLPVIRRLVGFTEMGTRIFNSTNPIVHAVRVRVAPRALARDRIQDAAAAMFGQLSAGYRGSALSEGGGGLGELRAGDRVPDTEGLYDGLDLSALTLFADTGSRRVVEVARDWTGVVAIRDRPAPHGGWLLVRPDGYLAAAGGPADGAALQRWLQRWFVKP